MYAWVSCRDKQHSTIIFEGPSDTADVFLCFPAHHVLPMPTAPPPPTHTHRDKEHSTIIFEGPSDTPLLRLGWNKQDPRFIATLLADSPKVCTFVYVFMTFLLVLFGNCSLYVIVSMAGPTLHSHTAGRQP